MTRNDERTEQRHRGESDGNVRLRAEAAQQDAADDWSLPSALMGGLALALLFNTFVGLIPG